jgi:hypothetical protein
MKKLHIVAAIVGVLLVAYFYYQYPDLGSRQLLVSSRWSDHSPSLLQALAFLAPQKTVDVRWRNYDHPYASFFGNLPIVSAFVHVPLPQDGEGFSCSDWIHGSLTLFCETTN